MPSDIPQDEARRALADRAESYLTKTDCYIVLNKSELRVLLAALRANPVRAAEEMREKAIALKDANDRLHIAFMVLSESGHGGAMHEVRRWFNSGTEKPIPWPGGALFEAWAAEMGIVNRNGAMAFDLPTQPAAEGGADG